MRTFTLPALVFVAIVLVLPPSPLLAEDDPLAEARRHAELRDHDLAEGALLLRLVDEAGDVEALRLLADVYLVTERPAEAGKIVRRALKAAPEDPLLNAALWEVSLAGKGWTREARAQVVREVDAFLEAAGDDAPLWRLTAAYVGYHHADAREKKVALVERILGRKPESLPEILEGDLFEAIIRERDAGKRVTAVHRFLPLFPESKQVNFVREILLYALREDRERLLAEADAILSADPDNRRVRAALARWLLRSEPRDPKRALARSRRRGRCSPLPARSTGPSWRRTPTGSAGSPGRRDATSPLRGGPSTSSAAARRPWTGSPRPGRGSPTT